MKWALQNNFARAVILGSFAQLAFAQNPYPVSGPGGSGDTYSEAIANCAVIAEARYDTLISGVSNVISHFALPPTEQSCTCQQYSDMRYHCDYSYSITCSAASGGSSVDCF
jgi:hypothetical protein